MFSVILGPKSGTPVASHEGRGPKLFWLRDPLGVPLAYGQEMVVKLYFASDSYLLLRAKHHVNRCDNILQSARMNRWR